MANPETTTGSTVPKLVEDDTSSTEKPTETTSATEAGSAVTSSFMERIVGIPVVDAALKYSTSAYKQVKEYNQITSYALTKAEETAVFLACSAVPYVKKIEPQVKAVDDLACRGLDLVEESLPVLTRPPEEILSETRKLCAQTLQTGYQVVTVLGTEAVTRAKNYGVQKGTEALGGCLSRTENLVDKYLPPTANEELAATPSSESLSVTERASNLKSKVGSRVYSHGLIQLQRMHGHGQEAMEKLAYTIDLVKYIRENYSAEMLKNYMDDAKIKASWIWEELRKEEPLEAAEAEKSVERRLISLARRLTSQLVHTYGVATTSVKEVPQSYQENLAAARTYAAELFTQLDKAIEKNEVTSSFLQMIREKVDALQNLAKSVVSSAPPQEIEMSSLSKDEAAKPEDAGASS